MAEDTPRVKKVWAIELWRKELDKGDLSVLASTQDDARSWLKTNKSDICDCYYAYARIYPVSLDYLIYFSEPDLEEEEWWVWQNGPEGYYNGGFFVPHLLCPPIRGQYAIGNW